MGGGISRQVSYMNQYTDTLSEHEIRMRDREVMGDSNKKGKGAKKGKGKRKKISDYDNDYDNNNDSEYDDDYYRGNKNSGKKGKGKRKKISDYDNDYDNNNDSGYDDDYYRGNKNKGKKGKGKSNSFDKMYEDSNNPYYIRRNTNSSFDNYGGNGRKNKLKRNYTYDRNKRNRNNSHSIGRNRKGRNNDYNQKNRKNNNNLNNKNKLSRRRSVDNDMNRRYNNYGGKGYYDRFLPYNMNRNNFGNEEFDNLNESGIIELSYYSSDEDRRNNSKKKMKRKYNSFINNRYPNFNNEIAGFYTNKNPNINYPNENQGISRLYYNNPGMYDTYPYNNQSSGAYNLNSRISNLYPNNNLGLNNSYSNNIGLYNYNSNLYPRLNSIKKNYNFLNSPNQYNNYSNYPHSVNSFYNKSNLSLKMDNYYNYTIKDLIYSEFERHRNYLDSTEKKCVEEINYSNFSNCEYLRYSKSILLHEREITSICSIKYNLRNICYATGSKDLKIKLWRENFECIFSKENLQYPPLILHQYQTRYLLSAEGIYIKLYDLNSSTLNLFQTLRDHISEIRTILILKGETINDSNTKIISGGKDKILRMWNVLEEKVIQYFEGHKDTITNIQYVGKRKNIIISMSIDKCFIVWEINTTNIIVMFNNYFTSTCILGTNFGFCCGSYDNKIRFYDKNYNMIKCLVCNFYDCDNFLMLTNNNLIFTTALNELIIINIDTDKIFSYYKGLKCDIKKMIKSYDWDLPEKNRINQLKGIKYKNILTVGNDGYVYIWECYQYLYNVPYNESDSESFDSF